MMKETKTIEIMGIKVPVTDKVLYTKSSPEVLAYMKAVKAGMPEAKKYFSK